MLILLPSFVLPTVFVLTEQQVEAAPAKCFVVTDGDTRRSDCMTNGVFIDLIRADSGFCLPTSCIEDDKCYVIENGALTTLNRTSAECIELRNNTPFNDPGGSSPPSGPGRAATGRFECTGEACVTDNPITRFLITVVNFLSALIGIIVIAVIIIAGIQYTTSGGNPQQAAQAKKRIINAVTALVAFFFLFAILQWLIPGGIFKS